MTPGAGAPVVAGRHGLDEVTDRVVGIPLSAPPRGWILAFGLASSLVVVMLTAVAWLLLRGVGVWGIQIPVAWGFAITNFVWWIGIGHAGTLISAILLLLRQEWRTSINRFAEAMTLFAVANAGLFPLLHLGRAWKFYYLFPYPSTLELWPQFRSPLVFDVIAVLTYGTVSLLFWYLGLVPDLASLRDRARARFVRLVAGIFALGWRGSSRHWLRYERAYLVTAGLATPLVVSVHSIVSFNFAVAIVPGWHSTIFPPYFVAGAIFSGFAMVLTLIVPVRRAYRLEDLITARHLDAMAKVTLASGLFVAYGYVMELFTAWYSADTFEIAMAVDRATGHYWPGFALMILGNVIAPQALWFRRVRRSPWTLFGLSLLINVGMWAERFVIVVQSLHRDYMPSAWKPFAGTSWDWLLLLGSLGFFVLLVVLFVRLVPMISIHELRALLSRTGRVEAPPAPEGPPERATAHGDAAAVVAEYARPEDLAAAAGRLAGRVETGRLEAFTPWPVDGLAETLGHLPTRIPAAMLAGGLAAGAAAFATMWYATAVDAPWNIGSRPLASWPSYIPITFELTVLGAVLVGFAALLVANRLPQLHHGMFDVPGFQRASSDRFFLRVAGDGADDLVRELVDAGGAVRITEVRT